ncbi:hypothetical protein [Plantactinospora endophytica]|nr:hypothetical protein [Plantactinospora endophytica]
MPEVLANCPDGAAVDDYLKSIGWKPFMPLGQYTDSLSIKSWRHADGGFLIAMSDTLNTSPFMKVDTFPELMDLFSRWAPAVQAAAISDIIGELSAGDLVERGMVEMVAARAAHGVEYEAPQLRREAQERKNR